MGKGFNNFTESFHLKSGFELWGDKERFTGKWFDIYYRVGNVSERGLDKKGVGKKGWL